MEQELIVEQQEAKKDVMPFKRVFAAYVIFSIAQIFVTVSIGSFGSNFKFLPKWLENFIFFDYAAYLLFFISTAMLFKYSKQFKYSFIVNFSMICLEILQNICKSSNEGLYQAWAKGIEWSLILLEAVFYGYFFQATYLLFNKYNQGKIVKKTKAFISVFFTIVALEVLVSILAVFPFIKNNMLANRLTLYSNWLLLFVFYIFILAITINCFIYIVRIHRKELERNENENN